ncbi:hypothetical protein PIIN_00192 [Serendipita indica DSM 11827]|uniref:Uncharacterized protein n=1 Tax=Serendipita indica (strain DSM 11827) TaxID=1109443 RepID=G4T5C5_SERID|nr:hypothetical protein PIIN_00192 [Serendipita indica DSM 11827]
MEFITSLFVTVPSTPAQEEEQPHSPRTRHSFTAKKSYVDYIHVSLLASSFLLLASITFRRGPFDIPRLFAYPFPIVAHSRICCTPASVPPPLPPSSSLGVLTTTLPHSLRLYDACFHDPCATYNSQKERDSIQ